jgi:hypothetical protein
MRNNEIAIMRCLRVLMLAVMLGVASSVLEAATTSFHNMFVDLLKMPPMSGIQMPDLSISGFVMGGLLALCYQPKRWLSERL